jgi:predicted nucleic acid-binding protein
MIFVDTSAYFNLLDKDDENNETARKIWETLIETEDVLVLWEFRGLT